MTCFVSGNNPRTGSYCNSRTDAFGGHCVDLVNRPSEHRANLGVEDFCTSLITGGLRPIVYGYIGRSETVSVPNLT